MANPFLQTEPRDVETAIMLEQAIVHDIGKAVAYTDGTKIFINTDDNLFKLLPAYDHRFLKWVLWHERYHKELRHHNRFFKYLEELRHDECEDQYLISKEEVNIIMDILVHDSLAKLFPELVEIAQLNLAQMRDRNALKYTFKTFTLEEMLDEYRKSKDPEEETEEEEETEDKDKSKDDEKKPTESPKKGHGAGGRSDPEETKDEPKSEDGAPELDPDAEEPEEEEKEEPVGHHDETDWSKLDDIDTKEFIDKDESDEYMEEIARLKRKKFRLGKLTETLNGLATTTRRRTYASPSRIHAGTGIILKGSQPGKTRLYLCFDASGSMGRELETFKEIIGKSIPQAMNTPTEWFSGEARRGRSLSHLQNPDGRSYDYYKGKFSDIMDVYADSGYSDDGDRTIEMCWKAEQAGYSPIGITDGGGSISWSTDKLKQLQRTIFVGDNKEWLDQAKKINPRIQTLDI